MPDMRRAVVGLAVLAMITACGSSPAVPLSSASGPASPPSASASPSASGTPASTARIDIKAPPGFVVVSDVDPSVLQDIRYATAHNFVGRPIAGYLEPLCILTRQTAEAIKRVQAAARAKGYTLKMYDCYRPQRAVDEFVSWAKDLSDQTMKAEFYPHVAKSQLFNDGYIGAPTAHSKGITMDLTIVKLPAAPQRPFVPGEPLMACTAPAAQRFPDNSVDMGTGFDCFDSLAHTLDPRVTGAARANRLLLKQLMTAGGFTNYVNEWWHYTLNNANVPNTFYNFPVARAALIGG